MDISVVIGSYNRLNMLILCIEEIRRELKDFNFEIIVIDGGSNDGSIDWLCMQKDIISIIQHNHGTWMNKTIVRKPWAYFMNLGFKIAKGKYICMLSDDSLIVPNAIKNGWSLAEDLRLQGRNIGAVAFYFRDYPLRKRYAVAVNIGNLYVNHGLFLNEAVKTVDYISEDYHFYFADTDLSLKIKHAGYEIIDSPNSYVEHYFDATPKLRSANNNNKKEEDRIRLIEKWFNIAYPAKDKSKYLHIVGYWKNSNRECESENMILKLIQASKRKFISYKLLGYIKKILIRSN